MHDFIVYIENSLEETSPYFISEEAVRNALGDNATNARIHCCSKSNPDIEALSTAHYFVGSGFDTQRIGRVATSVRIVHCTSAGVEKYMPMDWLPKGAVLTNSSGVHAEKGGAFGLMTVLMLLEGIPRHIRNQRNHFWDNQLSKGVSKQTVVFVGFGALGRAIGARLKALRTTIVSVTRSGRSDDISDKTFPVSRLAEVLPLADCLVISCPLTPETKGLIGRNEIQLLKRGATLFNIGRGAVLDEMALSRALENGHLSGAALDVFENEPLSADSGLWDVPNLLIFPHISCDEVEGYVDRCLDLFAANILRDQLGLSLHNRVDASLGY
ncbi:D-2-hydroxyacid dehydrogenase [Brucella pseudogrignonensis]|uniref:D-2-hydroxyacid dehydrogenase n=1 Tax=Brucella pseudogrignonensis TaxID=419475 RepID=UPI0028B76674|nr:D-2-hydroxyacid dehydrogenase [Brucella pseudogrignonensis]MDT6942541.1 D-2-hydroxyacid dehydrogenase [Brucella pseudogrignonensis]